MRAAWEMAVAELKCAIKQKQEQADPKELDWDAPLPNNGQKIQKANVKSIYRLLFAEDVSPCEPLFANSSTPAHHFIL